MGKCNDTFKLSLAGGERTSIKQAESTFAIMDSIGKKSGNSDIYYLSGVAMSVINKTFVGDEKQNLQPVPLRLSKCSDEIKLIIKTVNRNHTKYEKYYANDILIQNENHARHIREEEEKTFRREVAKQREAISYFYHTLAPSAEVVKEQGLTLAKTPRTEFYKDVIKCFTKGRGAKHPTINKPFSKQNDPGIGNDEDLIARITEAYSLYDANDPTICLVSPPITLVKMVGNHGVVGAEAQASVNFKKNMMMPHFVSIIRMPLL